MRSTTIRFFFGRAAFLAILCSAATAVAQTQELRIVTYNIEADIGGYTTPRPGLIQPSDPSGNATGTTSQGGVLEGIGLETVNSHAQPLDILALQETTSNSTTVSPIVSGLNAFYGAGTYAMSSFQAGQSGGNTGGNGPNALVYNTHTLQIVGTSTIIGTGGSGNGILRDVMRYEFAPASVTPNAGDEFYVYVSHYKSGSTTTDVNDRQGEATAIRSDENLLASQIGSNPRVLYVGDFNTGDTTEPMYNTLTTNSPNTAGKAIDIFNSPPNYTIDFDNAAHKTLLSESTTGLQYRDDYQMMTSDVASAVSGGLQYISGTYHVFGNNGTVGIGAAVDNGNNTSLNGNLGPNPPASLTASQLYTDLHYASDHYPVVADYLIPVPEPATLVLLGIGGVLLGMRAARRRAT